MKFSTIKKQAGMTLTESLLVLAVGALVAVLAYGGYKLAVGNVKQASAVDSAARMLSAIKKSFGSSGNYSVNVTTANLAKSGIVPTEFTVDAGAGTVIAPWAADANVTITTPPAAGSQTLAVNFTNVPTDVCLSLMAGIEGFTESMKAGPAGSLVAVKAAGGKFDSGSAAAQCGAVATVEATIK